MSAQDPELSAALGWPGGISDPVLDRTRLLQMAAALRLASQQALEALKEYGWHTEDCPQYPTYARPKNWPACTCGFDAAIKAVEGEKK